MTALWLVRHGPPAIDAETPAHEWPLSDAGARAVNAARARWKLPTNAVWRSSNETKALQTAALLRGEPVPGLDELAEMSRPAGWSEDFAALVERALTEPSAPASTGWETADSTRERVVGCVRDLLAEQPADLVLVGHGTAWTVLVAALTESPPDLAGWRSLALPDRCLLEVDASGTAEVTLRWGA